MHLCIAWGSLARLVEINVVLVFFFWQLRARDPASRGDRYMLVTFDEPPYGVKVISNWYIFYIWQDERFFCQWDFIVLLVRSQCRAAHRWRKSTNFFAPNTRRPRAAMPPTYPADILLLCWEKSRALRWRRRDLLSHSRHSFFQSTICPLAKKPANHHLLLPLHHPCITIGQPVLKVDKPSSEILFLWVRERKNIILHIRSICNSDIISMRAQHIKYTSFHALICRQIKQTKKNNQDESHCNDNPGFMSAKRSQLLIYRPLVTVFHSQ